MPNPIKYNSSTETNALNVGNFWIGTGDVDKGPTSVTGYYNGITPPPDGYTIYVHKANQGPSIRIASDDSELIEITNDIARASYTTITQCFNYFEGQNDKMVTHQTMNFRITDGLVLDLDGNNIPSYPHNGTTWHDLSEGRNDGNLINGTGHQFPNGYFYFDGVDDYLTIPNFSSLANSDGCTISIISNIHQTKGYHFWGNGIFLLQLQSNQTYRLRFNLDGNWRSTYNTTYPVNVYHKLDITWDGVTTKMYINSQETVSSTLDSSRSAFSNTTNQPLEISRRSGDYSDVDISQISIHNRALTSSEIAQNYYQGPIVTDGLIRALDFSNLVSYRIADTCECGFDLTGNGGFDLYNTPFPVTDFGGGISCNNTDEFIALSDKTPTDYVSVEVWFRRDNADSGENIIFNKENCWEIKEQGGNIYWALMANNRSWFWYDSTANIDVGETIQFVLTYDGDYVKSYKNGEFFQSYTYPSGGVLRNQNSCYPKLNSRNCTRTTPRSLGNMTYFQFRIYDRALSSDEVSKNYHATKYKFNHT